MAAAVCHQSSSHAPRGAGNNNKHCMETETTFQKRIFSIFSILFPLSLCLCWLAIRHLFIFVVTVFPTFFERTKPSALLPSVSPTHSLTHCPSTVRGPSLSVYSQKALQKRSQNLASFFWRAIFSFSAPRFLHSSHSLTQCFYFFMFATIFGTL